MNKLLFILTYLLFISCSKPEIEAVENEVHQYFNKQYIIESLITISEYKIIDKKTNSVIIHIKNPDFKIKKLLVDGKPYTIYEEIKNFYVYDEQILRLTFPYTRPFTSTTKLEANIRLVDSDVSKTRGYGKIKGKDEFYIDFLITL